MFPDKLGEWLHIGSEVRDTFLVLVLLTRIIRGTFSRRAIDERAVEVEDEKDRETGGGSGGGGGWVGRDLALG